MFTNAMKSSIASFFVIILSALIGGGCPGEEDKGQVATGLAMSSPDYAVAGDPITVTVRAIDSGGRTVPSYTGTIQFSSTDAEAVLPDDYTFSAADEGTHTFIALTTLTTSGSQTLTVSQGSNFSASKTIIVTGGALNELLLAVPITTVTSGVSVSMAVTAIDAYGNTISTYTGAVTFTSTDLKASFTTGSYYYNPLIDMGTHTFKGSFGTGGSQDVCVKDIVAGIKSCTSVFVYFSVVEPPIGLGQSAGVCAPDCPGAVGSLSLRALLINPSTELPWTGQTITAGTGNPSYPVLSISENGNGYYSVGVSVSIPSSFYTSITCSTCSGTPSMTWGGAGFTMANVYPDNCSVDAYGTPGEVAVDNPSAGTVNTLSSFNVWVKDSLGNPIVDSVISPSGSSAQVNIITDNKNGSYTVTMYDATSEVASIGASADGQGVPGAVTITYTSLNFVDGGYNPITTLSVATGTTTLNAYLLVGGTPTAGRSPLPGMTVSAGTSATLTTVTDATGGIYSADLTDSVAETVTVTTTDSTSGAKGLIEVTFN